MIKMLIRVSGLFLAVGALFPLWYGFEANDDIRKWENEIIKQGSENIRSHLSGGEGEKIAGSRHQIEKKTMERNIWFSVAGGVLIVGLGMVFLPSSPKRKALIANPAPPPSREAPLENQYPVLKKPQ